jgi:hypothetical protein
MNRIKEYIGAISISIIVIVIVYVIDHCLGVW